MTNGEEVQSESVSEPPVLLRRESGLLGGMALKRKLRKEYFNLKVGKKKLTRFCVLMSLSQRSVNICGALLNTSYT